MVKNRDKPFNKPKGSAFRIFSRLFREYAMRHWFRLFLGILSGLIMGGAMHASLNFMDFGLSSLNSSLSQKHDNHAAEKAGIAEKLKNNATISTVLKALKIDLSKIHADIQKIDFTVTIHEAEAHKQSFGQVENAFIRVVNAATNEELIRYDLGEDFSVETAVVVGELYRQGGEWKFNAIGSGFKGGLKALCQNFGVNV